MRDETKVIIAIIAGVTAMVCAAYLAPTVPPQPPKSALQICAEKWMTNGWCHDLLKKEMPPAAGKGAL